MRLGKKWLKKIRAIENVEDPLVAVCEVPADSRCKYKLNKDTGHLELARILSPDCRYPANYGFVPRTLSSDGMELDILVITSEPLLPLCTVECRIIGGFTLKAQVEAPEHKLLAVATKDPALEDMRELEHVDAEFRGRLERFFTTYKQIEGIEVQLQAWATRADALGWLREALAAA